MHTPFLTLTKRMELGWRLPSRIPAFITALILSLSPLHDLLSGESTCSTLRTVLKIGEWCCPRTSMSESATGVIASTCSDLSTSPRKWPCRQCLTKSAFYTSAGKRKSCCQPARLLCSAVTKILSPQFSRATPFLSTSSISS